MKVYASKTNDHLTLILGSNHYQFKGEKAEKVFDLAMSYKTDPTYKNLTALEEEVAPITKILRYGFLEESSNGEYFIKGTNIPLPHSLSSHLIEYAEKGYPTEALINFWKLCLTNPNKEARDSFFDYVKKYGVVITDKGYVVLYKSVEKAEVDNSFAEFVVEEYLKIKRWKKSPKNYTVYKTSVGYFASDKKYSNQVIGSLQNLYDNIDNIQSKEAYYTPHFKGGDYGNKIRLGVPVKMPREKCDPDVNTECSHGLHVGHESYVRNFCISNNSIILAVLVNPRNIVAIPEYDTSKIRVCEYFPYSIMAIGENRWEELHDEYIEEDYCDYEIDEIDELLKKYEEDQIHLENEQITLLKQRLIELDD